MPPVRAILGIGGLIWIDSGLIQQHEARILPGVAIFCDGAGGRVGSSICFLAWDTVEE